MNIFFIIIALVLFVIAVAIVYQDAKKSGKSFNIDTLTWAIMDFLVKGNANGFLIIKHYYQENLFSIESISMTKTIMELSYLSLWLHGVVNMRQN